MTKFSRPFQSFRLNKRLLQVVIFIYIVLSAQLSFAWDDVLIKAAEAYKKGKATNAQRAMLLARNFEVNLLAMGGWIDDSSFQACQGDFAKISEEIANDVAGKVGVSFQVQVSTSVEYKAGTDSDYITGATNADQVKKMQKKYNEKFTEKLRELGREVEDGTDWVLDNDIDFMGDPSIAGTQDFLDIADVNNAAYTRTGAARFEAYSRTKGRGAPNLQDTADYVDEMQDMIHHRDDMIRESQDELRELMSKNKVDRLSDFPVDSKDYKKAMELQADIYKNKAIQGKYMQRIGDATDELKRLLPPDVELGHNLIGSSSLPGRAKARNMLTNRMSPEVLSTMTDDIMRVQLQEHVEILAAVQHTNPAKALDCQTAIKKYCVHLTPQQRADIIDSIRKGLGDEAAKDLALIMKAAASNDPYFLFKKLVKDFLPEADYKKVLKALEDGNMDDLPASFYNLREDLFNLSAAQRTALSNPSTDELLKMIDSDLIMKGANPDTRQVLGQFIEKIESVDDPTLFKKVFGKKLTDNYIKPKLSGFVFEQQKALSARDKKRNNLVVKRDISL